LDGNDGLDARIPNFINFQEEVLRRAQVFEGKQHGLLECLEILEKCDELANRVRFAYSNINACQTYAQFKKFSTFRDEKRFTKGTEGGVISVSSSFAIQPASAYASSSSSSASTTAATHYHSHRRHHHYHHHLAH
jgi:hypothetical protein